MKRRRAQCSGTETYREISLVCALLQLVKPTYTRVFLDKFNETIQVTFLTIDLCARQSVLRVNVCLMHAFPFIDFPKYLNHVQRHLDIYYLYLRKISWSTLARSGKRPFNCARLRLILVQCFRLIGKREEICRNVNCRTINKTFWHSCHFESPHTNKGKLLN